MNKEKILTGSSYLFTFYRELDGMVHNYSQYLNVMVELENKYKEVNIKNIGEEEKNILLQTVQLVRYSIQKTYIQYSAIMEGLKEKNDPEIDNLFKELKQQFIINREALEKYVIKLNAVLVKDVIKELIQNTEKFINSIYDNDKNTTD